MSDNATPDAPEFDANAFDLGAITQAISDAPDAGYINQNFGRMTLLPQIVHWTRKPDGTREKVARPMTKGQNPDPNKGESLELKITVDISEFNPALEFSYERNVTVRNSTDKDKSDWTEIVEPAFVAVLGKGWLAKALERPYVCIEDVANVNKAVSKKSGKVLTVPKLIAVYANAAECKLARDARYNTGTENDPNAALNAVVDQVKQLMNALGGDMVELEKALANPPFNTYDASTLVALALAG